MPSTSLKTLQQLREAKGYSVHWAASRAGMTPQALSDWENERAALELDKLLRLARFFQVAVEEIALPPTQRLVTRNNYRVMLAAHSSRRVPERWDAEVTAWQAPAELSEANEGDPADLNLFDLTQTKRYGTGHTAAEALDDLERQVVAALTSGTAQT